MAQLPHSIPHSTTTAQERGTGRPYALLRQRGISDTAIARAGIVPNGNGWAYPYSPNGQAMRWKAYDSHAVPKYRWIPRKPDDARLYDPAGDLAHHVAAADGVLILAAGEPDVWALWTAGIFNTTTTMAGEGSFPADFAATLRALGVRVVRYYPDRDEAGQAAVPKLRDALAGTGISLEVFTLPAPLGSKLDINALLLQVGPEALPAALAACPRQPVPLPVRRPARKAVAPGAFEDTDRAAWALEVERIAVATWDIAPPDARGFSRRKFRSPVRDDRQPSAQWNYRTHGFRDWGTGTDYNTDAVAELLGIPRWQPQRASERSDALTAHITTYSEAQHYPHGYPHTLKRRLLTAKAVTATGADLAEWCLIDRIYTECAMPAEVTVAEFVKLAAQRGIRVDRHLVTRALKSAEGIMARFLPNSSGDGQLGKKRAKNRGRPATRWLFLPAHERLTNILAALEPLVRAPRRLPAVAEELAAVAGYDATADLAVLDAARQPVLDAAADERDRHRQRAERLIEYARRDAERILTGNYYADDPLPPGTWSVPALRAYEARRLLADGVEVNTIIAQTGLSRPTLLRLADEAGYEPVPQTDRVPAERLTDSMKARGVVLAISDGVATIRRPNVFRKRDQVTADEARAALEQRARQRGLARRRWQVLPQGDSPDDRAIRREWRAAQRDHEAERVRQALASPSRRPKRQRHDRLDAWFEHQWALCPPLSPEPTAPDGTPLCGRARWLAAFEVVRGGAWLLITADGELVRQENMMFTHYSAPRDEAEKAPLRFSPQPQAQEQVRDPWDYLLETPQGDTQDDLIEFCIRELGAVVSATPYT